MDEAGQATGGDEEIGGSEGAREGVREVKKSRGEGSERSLVAP